MKELLNACVNTLYYAALWLAAVYGAVFSFKHNIYVLGAVFAFCVLFCLVGVLVCYSHAQKNAKIIDEKLKRLDKEDEVEADK